MQARLARLLVAIALTLIGLVPAAATPGPESISPSIGKWKLNVTKSKADPTPLLKSEIRTYEDWGGGLIHAVFEGVDSDGKPVFREYVARFDGKDYPWVRRGSPTAWTISLKKVDSHVNGFSAKEDGKVSQTGTVTFSADGKLLTVTYKGTNAQGQPVGGVLVFDRQ